MPAERASRMTAIQIVVAYVSVSLIALATAEPVMAILPASVSLAITCLLGPIGVLQFFGLNIDHYFRQAMMLYLPATTLLMGSLFLANRESRALKVSGYVLALLVWALCGYVMFLVRYYGH
jgi:hypothetical protein